MSSVRQYLAGIRTRDSFTRRVASTFGVQVLTLLLNLATGAITARWLGAEGRGLLQLCLLLPAMLSLFLSGGIGVANIRFLGTRRYDVPTLTTNALTFAILGTILGSSVVSVLIVTGAIDRLFPGVPMPLLIVAMLGLPLTLLSFHFSTILQGLQRIMVLNRITLINGCVLLLLIVILVIGLRLGVVGAVAATLITNTFSFGQMVRRLRREGARFVPKWDRGVMRATLRFGLREYAGNILQFCNYRLDAFLVNGMLGAASVGLYGVATRLAEVVWYFPSAVGFALLPKAAATEAREMNRFTPRVFLLTLGVTTVAVLGLALLGKPLIRIIYAEGFVASYAPMAALLPGVALLGAARVLTSDISGRGHPLYNSIISGIALVLTVVLNLILIPRLGIMGAAVASTCSYTVTFLGALVCYRIVSRQSGPSPVVSETTSRELAP